MPPGVDLEPLSCWNPEARTHLSASYGERHAVKALGALFDGDLKQWYVRGGTDLRPFACWL